MPVKPLDFVTDKRVNQYYEVGDILKDVAYALPASEAKNFAALDTLYRALCSMLYNFAPLSGHPGGSISSGPIANSLIYNFMDYDFNAPDRQDADLLSYSAGHKALGLYALSALRNEIIKTYAPALLPADKRQLRLEDLLSFRKSPACGAKLLKELKSKFLDGHPVPVTPFVKLATGASGVGLGSSVGLGLGAAAAYGQNAPKVNIIEGEGGLTAGRCAEALAIAATSGLDNIVLHLDWNQASIDSDRVTAENGVTGDYVAWTPCEMLYINGLNVIYVDDGKDFAKIYAAQKFAQDIKNGRPTAIVYRTVKGWRYGVEGKASHGSGHKYDSPEFYATLAQVEADYGVKFPAFNDDKSMDSVVAHFWDCLQVVRQIIQNNIDIFAPFAAKIEAAQKRLNALGRQGAHAGDIEGVYTKFNPQNTPAEFIFKPGANPTLRGVLGEVLAYISKQTNGSMLVGTADLSGSTGAGAIAKPYAKGFYNKFTNEASKLVASGGICEDGLSAVMSGVSAFGAHIGVAASYAAFTAPMMHTAARLHAIGQQCKGEAAGLPTNTFIIFNGHAGLPTGEDGPTHADPQALQLVNDNFPLGHAITLTPLDANDIWPSLAAALQKRPAVLYPTVPRPNVVVADRAAAVGTAADGVYALCRAGADAAGAIIIQGSGAGEIFANQVLPQLQKEGLKLNVYYVASRELFELLPAARREEILPLADMRRAIAITDFTMPTMHCWLKSQMGGELSIHPFMQGRYLSSGQAPDVYKEAHMDAASQLTRVKEYLTALASGDWQ